MTMMLVVGRTILFATVGILGGALPRSEIAMHITACGACRCATTRMFEVLQVQRRLHQGCLSGLKRGYILCEHRTVVQHVTSVWGASLRGRVSNSEALVS